MENQVQVFWAVVVEDSKASDNHIHLYVNEKTARRLADKLRDDAGRRYLKGRVFISRPDRDDALFDEGYHVKVLRKTVRTTWEEAQNE